MITITATTQNQLTVKNRYENPPYFLPNITYEAYCAWYQAASATEKEMFGEPHAEALWCNIEKLTEYVRVLKTSNAHGVAHAMSLRAQIETATDRLEYLVSMQQPISDFQFSARLQNCFRRLNIRTVGDLLRHSEEELLSARNFGRTSLCELRERLLDYGMPQLSEKRKI